VFINSKVKQNDYLNSQCLQKGRGNPTWELNLGLDKGVIVVGMVAIGLLIDKVMVTSSSVSFQCAAFMPSSCAKAATTSSKVRYGIASRFGLIADCR